MKKMAWILYLNAKTVGKHPI